MKLYLHLASLILLFGFITACSLLTAKNQSNFNTPEDSSQVGLKPDQRYTSDPLQMEQNRTPAGRFNALIVSLADQLERNADRKILGNTFIVTSFGNLNKLSETTGLGRLIAENLIHELQIRKWQVYDVRLTKDLLINESGEFSLSRDIKKIRETYKVGGIVTGTYVVADYSIIVNARSMDINTGVVASSGRISLPVDGFTDALLFNEDNLKTMKIVGDGTVGNGK